MSLDFLSKKNYVFFRKEKNYVVKRNA